MARYRFYEIPGNQVVCVSRYAGKSVRGIAKCNPTDEYDFAKGKAIAQARVDAKIAAKKVKAARNDMCAAYKELEKVKTTYQKYVERYGIKVVEADAATLYANNVIDE